MDANKCPRCGKRMIPVLAKSGRTELNCPACDEIEPIRTDAGAEGPLAAPTKAA